MKKVLFFTLLLTCLLMTACTKKEKKQVESPKGTESNPFILGVSPMSGWYGWYGIEGCGLFKRNDVSVKIQFFPVYSDSLTAFYSGKLDGICIAASDAIAPYNEEVDFKIVLVNDNSYGADGLVVHSDVKAISDLKGKSVSTEVGTLEHMFLLKILEDNGMTIDDVNFSNMTINDAGPAFIADSVDAAVLWEPTLSTAIAAGGRLLYSTKETPGLIPDTLAVNSKLIAQNPELIQKIVDSWFDGVNMLKARDEAMILAVCKGAELSKDEYIVMLDGVTLFDKSMNQQTFKNGDDYTSLPYTLQKSAEFLKSTGMIDKVPEDLNGILDDSFIK
ncbi:MAG: ABC transporter substrate-binding protein [Treponema sp.]|nr:ABC transporter substrate-binding protein [Treponema sp.]